MKVEISKQVTEVQTIEVELPYYYKHDLMLDHSNSIIYGKIEKRSRTFIKEAKWNDGDLEYEIKKEEYPSLLKSGLGSYFENQNRSTKEEYEAVKSRCFEFLKDF